jgi:hypothetical protein
MQRIGKKLSAAINIKETTEELLDVSFFMRSAAYQRKAGDWFFLELILVIINATVLGLTQKGKQKEVCEHPALCFLNMEPTTRD